MYIYQLSQDIINSFVKTFKATGITAFYDDICDLDNNEDLAYFYDNDVSYVLETIKEELDMRQEALDDIADKALLGSNVESKYIRK